MACSGPIRGQFWPNLVDSLCLTQKFDALGPMLVGYLRHMQIEGPGAAGSREPLGAASRGAAWSQPLDKA